MKKHLQVLFILLFGFLFSCKSKLEESLKSSDPAEIIATAKYYYEKGNYENASKLYSHAKKFVYGTDYAKEVDYYSALTSLKDKNYPLAAQQFGQYANRYPNDSLSEESQYMSAFCYYKGSLPYNLDPKNTNSAIAELQRFINLYPNSDKIDECNELIQELHVRLEEKAYENAKTLYKIAKYPSSSVAFDNVINDYPDTKYKESALYYSFMSKAEYAFHSFDNLKEDRFNDAMTTYRLLIKDYPNTEYKADADKVVEKINEERKTLKEQNLVNNSKN